MPSAKRTRSGASGVTSSWCWPRVPLWLPEPKWWPSGSSTCLATPFEIAGSDLPLAVTASIGIAEGRRATPDELLRDADIALYQAKAAGKKCAVVFAPAMQEAVEDHRNLEMDLQCALEADQFFLLYQPTFDLSSGAFTGVEALFRWRHPTRGVIQPDDFIPALEASGLIVPVGRWVLQEACRQGAAWQRQGHRITRLDQRLGQTARPGPDRRAMCTMHSRPADSIPPCVSWSSPRPL